MEMGLMTWLLARPTRTMVPARSGFITARNASAEYRTPYKLVKRESRFFSSFGFLFDFEKMKKKNVGDKIISNSPSLNCIMQE